RRRPPPPRPAGCGASHAISREISLYTQAMSTNSPPAPPDRVRAPRRVPELHIDLGSPEAAQVTPTVLSIPTSILDRVRAARRLGPSYTALLLDALRTHAADLPDLV